MAGILERAFNTRSKAFTKEIPNMKPTFPVLEPLGFHWSKEFLDFAYDAFESIENEEQAAEVIYNHFSKRVTMPMVWRTINYFKGDIFVDVETLSYHWLTAVLPLNEVVGGFGLGDNERLRLFFAYCLENKYDLRPEPVGRVQLSVVEDTFNVIAEVIERDSKYRPAS